MKRMRPLSRSLLLAVLSLSGILAFSARADVDFSGLDKAITNLFSVLDKLVVDVPKVGTSEGATQVLDAWTGANSAVADAGEAVVRENPGFETNPPPRLTQYFRRCTTLPSKYTPVTAGIGSLIKQYRQEPNFASALGRYQRSLERLHLLLNLGVDDHD